MSLIKHVICAIHCSLSLISSGFFGGYDGGRVVCSEGRGSDYPIVFLYFITHSIQQIKFVRTKKRKKTKHDNQLMSIDPMIGMALERSHTDELNTKR